jgi:hypothetical protein
MAKHAHNICDETEKFVFDSECEEMFMSDNSESESTNDLSEYTDHSIPENEEWHERISKHRDIFHQFTASNPGLIHAIGPNITGDSSSFDCFRLMFTY